MFAIIFIKQLRNSYFAMLYVAAVTLGGVALIAFGSPPIFLFFNRFQNDFVTFCFKYYTHIGDGIFYVIVALLLAIKNWKWCVAALICFATTGIISYALKESCRNMKRPFLYFTDLHIPIKIPAGVEPMIWNSFPSGHTFSAFSMAVLLSFLFNKKAYQILFFVMAFLVACSRMYLCQHFFRDVFWGMVMGTEITFVLIYFMKNNLLKGVSFFELN